MNQNRIKVLMLGWEFPPLLTGGLGQATFGIANALAPLVDLTLIIPQKKGEPPLSQASIVGLNQVEYDDSFEILTQKKIQENLKITYVDASFDLYPAEQRKEILEVEKKEIEIDVKIPIASKKKALFEEDNVYGPNTLQKVALYAQTVAELAKDMEFDVIHAHDWVTFPAAMKLKEETGKPIVIHVHSLETDRVDPTKLTKIFEIEQKAMVAANAIVAVSDFTKENILNKYKADPQKTYIVHNGIDEISALPAKKKTKKNNIPKILFLGRITRQKGPTFLVETAVLLSSKIPNLKFVVAGIGERLRETMAYAQKRSVLNLFEFVGFLDKQKIAEIASTADAYFLPSVSEPFGLSTLEAAQAGLPVVISKQSGATEVMPNALKADYWDTQKFANYLYGLLTHKGLKEEIVSLNKVDLKTLTWGKASEDLHFLYQKLIS
ncbi:glycosyltransferase [Flammeovirgaceae bacterium SG7u.111]|nr:glycosyltransferase [Flammeovirgaceae bacterium SG7u.132]WPO33111.1 glycosyltransferase [Flammeovirgaceae bacterium SG7u.111]